MQNNKQHTKHPTVINDLDPELTDTAEHLYEELIAKEGFSDEQAMAMAMFEVGETDGELDLDVNEEELVEHEEEPIALDVTQSDRPPEL